MRPASVRNKISRSMKGSSNFEGKTHDRAGKKKIADGRGHDDRVDGKKWIINKITGKTNRVRRITSQVTKYGRSLKSFREWIEENFANGRNPQDKGDSKRLGVPTKASVATLRKVAKQGGRKGQLAHWMANMKAGKKK